MFFLQEGCTITLFSCPAPSPSLPLASWKVSLALFRGSQAWAVLPLSRRGHGHAVSCEAAVKVRALYHALPIVLAIHLHSYASPLTTVCLHSKPPALPAPILTYSPSQNRTPFPFGSETTLALKLRLVWIYMCGPPCLLSAFHLSVYQSASVHLCVPPRVCIYPSLSGPLSINSFSQYPSHMRYSGSYSGLLC